jgi:hypothetical protein
MNGESVTMNRRQIDGQWNGILQLLKATPSEGKVHGHFGGGGGVATW